MLHEDGDEAAAEFLLFSAQNFLHICYPAALDRVRGRALRQNL